MYRQLTLDELDAYARLAGWPCELIPEVLEVARCESNLHPFSEGTSADVYGLMQLAPLWFDYAGTSFDAWGDPQVNLWVARQAYLYDLTRGQEPWAQWECKPTKGVT